MAKKLRRYKMKNLPKVPRQQVQLINALLWKLPQTAFEAGFRDRLRELLEPLLHSDVEVWFDGVRSLEQGTMATLLGEPCCAAVIGLPPRAEKALLEVDLAVAQLSIDKILGGNAEDTDVQRPLSEIEDGVFSFVLLKVLGLFAADAADEGAAQLKLEGMYGTWADLKERFPVDDPYLVLSFKVFFGSRVGYARLFLPEALVTEAFQPTSPPEGLPLERSIARTVARASLVRTLSAPLTVEVGRISFSMADLEALEVEDIILVEETEVRMEGGTEESAPVVTGRVTCRVGAGNHGTLQAVVGVADSGRYQIEIEGISPAGEPPIRAHLFRQAPSAEGEDDMTNEHARRTSAKAVTADDAGLMARLREDAARRARGGAPVLGPPGGAHRNAAEPGAEHSDDPDDEGGDAPSAEAMGLLDDVSVAMAVELGRVTVSAVDVLGLRPGQVIELSRAPGEPVDLVVDGKRVGKGELVEIDGELGVRILSLAKAG